MPEFSIRAFVGGSTTWAAADALAGIARDLPGREARGVRVVAVTVSPAVRGDRVSVELVVDAASGHDAWIGAEQIVREAVAPYGHPELLTPGADSLVHVGLGWTPGRAWPADTTVAL